MKKLNTILFLILILSSNLSLAFGATNEGYGEDSTALGQFVDTFDNANNVSVAVNVINNATLGVMELNYTSDVSGYENFTAYTEVDPDGDITITSDVVIDWTTMRRDSDSHAWMDYGIDYFGNFELQFILEMIDVEAGDSSNVAICWVFALSNSNGGRAGLHASDGIIIELSQTGSTDDRFRFRLAQQDGGAGTFATFGAGNWGMDIYYLTFTRVGTTVTLKIYDDEGRTNLIETISNGSADITEYRYVETAIGYDVAGDPADHSTGSIEYLDMGDNISGYSSDGYFNTTDYLLNPLVNGSVLAHQTIADIPANTTITIQFSPNGTDWYNNLGAIGSNSLTDGLCTIELRNLNYSVEYSARFNLSTTNSAITPRLNQSKLITTIGNSTGGSVIIGGGGGLNSATILMLILLCILAELIYIGVKKK